MDFINLSLKSYPYEQEVKDAINKVLNSGVFVGGEEVKEFESELSRYIDSNYCVSCGSGSDAIFLALKALGIQEGDEVLVPSFTYIATANNVAHCGADPVFCDVKEDTFNIDVKSAEKQITKETKAIIPVHLFGQPADMDKIMKLANKHGLYVIEDCAQSIGATYKNKQTGSIGDIGCFSFYPTKNLGGFGDGGAITTDNEKLAKRIKKLSQQGEKKKYFSDELGYNSRLDSLQAAVLRVKLNYLEDEIESRQKQAEKYDKKISNAKTPVEAKHRTHTYNQYTIKTEDREKYTKKLEEKNIPYKIYYPKPLHLQKCFDYLNYKKGDFPKSEVLSKQVLSLPILFER